MKSIAKAFAGIALALALFVGLAGSASAAPTNVSYTADGPLVAGVTVTFTATATCGYPPCYYEWRGFRPGLSRLGTPLGYGPTYSVKALAPSGFTLVVYVTDSYPSRLRPAVQYSQYVYFSKAPVV